MANRKIVFNKPIRFYPDRGLHKADMLYLEDVIFANENVCLCTVMGEDFEIHDKRTLFDIKTGEVLTTNLEYGNYYAENYDKNGKR